MHDSDWKVNVRQHPGSSRDDIDNEPNWSSGHEHHPGQQNRNGRKAGITHVGDEGTQDSEFKDLHDEEEAVRGADLKSKVEKGELVNFRDVVGGQEDFKLHHPEHRPVGWRYVVEASESWIKEEEDWPANIEKRKKKEEEEKKQKEEEEKDKKKKKGGKEAQQGDERGRADNEHEWSRKDDKSKHNDAYPAAQKKDDGGKKEKKHKTGEKKGQTGDESDEKEQGKKKQKKNTNEGAKGGDKKDERKEDKEDDKDDDRQDEEGDKKKDVKGDNKKDGKNDAKRDDKEDDDGNDDDNDDDDNNDDDDDEKSKEEKLHEKYTPQEISLLRVFEHEKNYIQSLKQDDGKRESFKGEEGTVTIDEADQFTPDNWIPRSSKIMRLTGKHPLNGQADVTELFDAGFITPNDLHYVRNHGQVPRLMREVHQLDIQHGKARYSMEDIEKMEWINIPIAMACSSNRRKELNMIKKSKGYNWGAGAVSCAFWKGVPLRDILLDAGALQGLDEDEKYMKKRYWVNLEGADEPNGHNYATSIPLQYAMDPTADVIVAYEMNGVPLPPDHGYPLRLMIPGYIGGRCVKWLRRIWISDKENDSYWQFNDNRTLPSFVTDLDGEFADVATHHPDTACFEQNLNSVIVKPENGKAIPFTEARKGKTFRIEGYAYDGAGHEVQRVEVSLDEGKTWLYCLRKFPEAPIRHGNKFWVWTFWHIDVDMVHLLNSPSITVRCFNVFKNTQPQHPSWNLFGTMNNCWYTVKTAITTSEDSDVPNLSFQHPVMPGTDESGWQQPSIENKIAKIKEEAAAPQKQFTKDEIEKHNSEGDCWIVVDNRVYDATSVLDWHPGGGAAIMTHAGKVYFQTTDEYSSIHDAYAHKKLQECILGVVTDKAAEFIKKSKEAAAKEAEKAGHRDTSIVLQKHRWVPVKLKARKSISEDTRVYTFQLPEGTNKLGLGTCQHIQVGFHMRDRMVTRPYTPTRPLLPAKDDKEHGVKIEEPGDEESKEKDPEDGDGQQQKGDGDSKENDGSRKDGDTKQDDSSNQGDNSQQDDKPQKDNDSDSKQEGEDSNKENKDGDSDKTMFADLDSLRDGLGTFDLTVKTYFPTKSQPGGALSNILDCLPIGEDIEIRGPTGDILYNGHGSFTIDDKEHKFKKISLVLGGSGVTPGYALIARILLSDGDDTVVRVIDANKSENDILLKTELDIFAADERYKKQFKIMHVLSDPSEEWKGKKGYVNEEMIKEVLFPGDEEGSVMFLCGPPIMIEKAVLPVVKEWGYEERVNLFGF